MRAWLQKWGIKIRRFPIWLQIFNVLCLVTLMSIAGAGLYFLTPQSKSTAVFLIEGRLNHSFVIERAQSGDRQSLIAELKKVPETSQESLVREIGALCEARLGPLLLECAEQDIARSASLEAFERWRRAFAHKKDFPEGSKELDSWLQELPEAERFLPLAAESLIFGDILARRLAVTALAKREDASAGALLIFALRAPHYERGIHTEALQALVKLHGEVDDKLSWSEIIAFFEKKSAGLPKELSAQGWKMRIQEGLESENADDLRRALLALNLLGERLSAEQIKEQLESPYSPPRELTRALIIHDQSLSALWPRLPKNQWAEALLVSAQYAREKPAAEFTDKIAVALAEAQEDEAAPLRAAWLAASLEWDFVATEAEVLRVFSKDGGSQLERQSLLRNLKRLRPITAKMTLAKIAKTTVQENDRALAKRLLAEYAPTQ